MVVSWALYDARAVLHPRNDAYMKAIQLSTRTRTRSREDTQEDIIEHA